MNLKERLREIQIRRPKDLREEMVELAKEHEVLIGGLAVAGALTMAGAIILFKYLRNRTEGNLINRITFFFDDRLGKRTGRGVIDEITSKLGQDPTVEALGNLAIPEAAEQIAEDLKEDPEGKKIVSLLEEAHQKISKEFGFPTADSFSLGVKIEITSAAIGAFMEHLLKSQEEE